MNAHSRNQLTLIPHLTVCLLRAQVVDLALNVNVEFMLCPTTAMLGIFAAIPDYTWLIWPSYRSTLTIAVMLVAPPLSYSYILVAGLLRALFGRKRAAVKVN